MEKPPASRTRAHIRYKCADGRSVPGVTTVLGILNKPALVRWANNLGLQGIDSTKYVDEKAAIGTLAHSMVEAHLKGETPDTSEYSSVQIDRAETCFLWYLEWEAHHKIDVALTEAAMVSETYRFGGTIDCLATVDGELTLLDFKTSNGVFPEHMHQLAAYRQLAFEHGYRVKGCRIIRIGRDDSEGFEEKHIGSLDKHWELFVHCLAVYRLQQELKGGKC